MDVTLRQLLVQSFSDEELRALVFDHFPDLHREFTVGMTLSHIVRLLLEYAQHHVRIPELLDIIERERPGLVLDRDAVVRQLENPQSGAAAPSPSVVSPRTTTISSLVAVDRQDGGQVTGIEIGAIHAGVVHIYGDAVRRDAHAPSASAPVVRLAFEPVTLLIRAGTFLMGGMPGPGIPDHETPQHAVTSPYRASAFWRRWRTARGFPRRRGEPTGCRMRQSGSARPPAWDPTTCTGACCPSGPVRSGASAFVLQIRPLPTPGTTMTATQ
jgi:hypothetical protein